MVYRAPALVNGAWRGVVWRRLVVFRLWLLLIGRGGASDGEKISCIIVLIVAMFNRIMKKNYGKKHLVMGKLIHHSFLST